MENDLDIIELAEDMGHHVGDGHMGVYNKSDGSIRYEFVYSGNAKNDKNYFIEVLIPRKRKLYKIKNTKWRIVENEIRFCFNSKETFHFFKEKGINSGPKDNIAIPQFIKKGNIEIKLAFLRGLFDSDGSLAIKKRHRKVHYYPTITITTKSKKLSKDIVSILKELEFSSILVKRERYDERTKKIHISYQIDINGSSQLIKWMNTIGSKNFHHLNKYKNWAKGS